MNADERDAENVDVDASNRARGVSLDVDAILRFPPDQDTIPALVAEVKRLREYADEMERQRNAYGAALSRAADGESAVEMAAEAMLALWGAE